MPIRFNTNQNILAKRLILALPQRRKHNGGSILETPLALIIMVMVLFFMMSMMSAGCGYATLNFAAQNAVREAGASQTKTAAQAAMTRVGDQILSGPFGKFGGVRPLDASGLRLRVFRLSDDGGAPVEFSPTINSPVDIDTNKFSYNYVVDATYRLRPLFWTVDVPARSQSTCVVEHPEGLAL